MTALREKLPDSFTMPLIGSSGGSSAAATSTCAQSNADDSLSLAPMLVSLGKKVGGHVPGEGLPAMIQAGLGESGHSF